MPDSQKRSGEDLGETRPRKTTFANDAINEGIARADESARILKKRLPDEEAHRDLSEEEDVDVSLMEALEDAEEQTLHMVSLDYCLPMITCEEPVDISFLSSNYAKGLSDAVGCTRVGEVRHLLDGRLDEYMLAELCGEALHAGLKSTGEGPEPELGESIFDHASQLGIVPGEAVLSDRWDRDPLTATWTRSILIPRKTFFHPDGEDPTGPNLSILSGKRTTLLSTG